MQSPGILSHTTDCAVVRCDACLILNTAEIQVQLKMIRFLVLHPIGRHWERRRAKVSVESMLEFDVREEIRISDIEEPIETFEPCLWGIRLSMSIAACNTPNATWSSSNSDFLQQLRANGMGESLRNVRRCFLRVRCCLCLKLLNQFRTCFPGDLDCSASWIFSSPVR